MRLRLRTRVAVAFALLAIATAGVTSIVTYAFASGYLITQRQNAALTRAILDSRAAEQALTRDPAAPVLVHIPSVGTSQQMVLVEGAWQVSDSRVPPEAIPAELIDAATPFGAQQRFGYGGRPWFGVAIPVTGGVYVELFPLSDLDQTLRVGAWGLVGLVAVAAMAGALIGRAAFGGILGPVQRVGQGARLLADGDLSVRIATVDDPDIDPIATSFNEMAEAMQERIARERRFAANVSHELRSPLTSIQGTAELLESRGEGLSSRDAPLVQVLVTEVRRLSGTLRDLLEISLIEGDDAIQWEATDVASVCRDVLADAHVTSCPIDGDRPTLRTDARRLQRILGNLIGNAESHGHGVTRILIEADDQAVVIHVDDAGPGVPPDERLRVLEPFQRGAGAESADGAGLGLAIAQEQAGFLGGGITLAASPAGGMRATVRLPVTREADA